MYAEERGHSRGGAGKGILTRTGAWFALLLVILPAGCAREREDPLPPRLGEVSLARRLDGEAAGTIVDRMHGKGVAPLRSMIGFYGDDEGAGAVLYVSVYGESVDASVADGKMRDGITRGGGVFSSFAEYVVAGRRISGCDGMGLRHYFFAAGKEIYWIAAPKEKAFSLAQELAQRLADRDAVSRR